MKKRVNGTDEDNGGQGSEENELCVRNICLSWLGDKGRNKGREGDSERACAHVCV